MGDIEATPPSKGEEATIEKKKREKNPRFQDLEETGKWGDIGKKEKYIVTGIACLVIIGVAVVLGITLGGGSDDTESPPTTLAPTNEAVVMVTPQEKLDIVIEALEYSNYTDASSLSNDASFYSSIDESSASLQQRTMKWLLADEYEIPIEEPDKVSQRFALAYLYYSLGGEDWKNNEDWLSSKSTCDWARIECEIGSDAVREVVLNENNLSGTIPQEVALLGGVKSIWFDGNQLQGELPGGALGELKKLTVLFLSKNQLSGTIPKEVNAQGTLNTLFCQENNFSGGCPFCPSILGGPKVIQNFGLDCDKVFCRAGCCDSYACY